VFGFVSFNDIDDYHSSLAHMGGTFIGSRPIKVNTARKEKHQLEAQYNQKTENTNSNYYYNQPQQTQRVYANKSLNLQNNSTKEVTTSPDDPNNAVLFIGPLSGATSEDKLYRLFSAYGEIKAVKLSHNRDCGFVEFYRKMDAKNAFALDGTLVDMKKISINWGNSNQIRTPSQRFKKEREERTNFVLPLPHQYRPSGFNQPYNVLQSNQHFLQQNINYLTPVDNVFLNHIVPSKNYYQNHYY
jgi:RNA recognition motif-containing protein